MVRFQEKRPTVDGQLDLAFNATGRSSLALRFDYKHNKDNDGSQNQLEWLYSLNGGSSWSGATLFTVTDNNTWASKSITLPAALDGQSNIIVRLQKYATDSNATEVNNVLLFDNIELTAGGGNSGGSQSPVLAISSSSASIPATNPVALCGTIGDSADLARTAISISPADADTPGRQLDRHRH